MILEQMYLLFQNDKLPCSVSCNPLVLPLRPLCWLHIFLYDEELVGKQTHEFYRQLAVADAIDGEKRANAKMLPKGMR